jgi:hypothetical protein
MALFLEKMIGFYSGLVYDEVKEEENEFSSSSKLPLYWYILAHSY